jgi:hypothetical protein
LAENQGVSSKQQRPKTDKIRGKNEACCEPKIEDIRKAQNEAIWKAQNEANREAAHDEIGPISAIAERRWRDKPWRHRNVSLAPRKTRSSQELQGSPNDRTNPTLEIGRLE